MKVTFCHVKEVANQLVEYIEKRIETDIDLKEIAVLYTIDTTSNNLFGYYPGSLDGTVDEDHKPFHSFNFTDYHRTIESIASQLLPFLFKVTNFQLFGSKFSSLILSLVPKILEERIKSGVERNDFVDLLLELKLNNELTEIEICAQFATFFVTGR